MFLCHAAGWCSVMFLCHAAGWCFVTFLCHAAGQCAVMFLCSAAGQCSVMFLCHADGWCSVMFLCPAAGFGLVVFWCHAASNGGALFWLVHGAVLQQMPLCFAARGAQDLVWLVNCETSWLENPWGFGEGRFALDQPFSLLCFRIMLSLSCLTEMWVKGLNVMD